MKTGRSRLRFHAADTTSACAVLLHAARTATAGAVLLAAACQRTQAGPLGQVAWISGDSLYAQALPVGKTRLLGVTAGLRGPVFSPSGRWLAVRAHDGLRLVRTDGDGGEKLAGPEATACAWAPSDDRIAYVAGGNLLLTRAGGIGTVLVDRTGAPAVTSVAWSPDGQWLAFRLAVPGALATARRGGPAGAPAAARTTGEPAGAPSTLWRMPARGGTPAPLATLPLAWAPAVHAWAPGGRPVLVLPRGHRLVLRPGAGGTATLRLTTGEDAEGQLVARLSGPRAAPTVQADAGPPWTDLVAYSPR
jgi:hypothetical protein